MTTLNTPKSLFRSARLIYRAIENNDADKAFIQQHIQNDSFGQAMSNPTLTRPRPQKDAGEFIQHLQHSSLLAVIICLPPSESCTEKGADALRKPIPIGQLSIINTWGKFAAHHRNATLGISLAEEYRGKGYGTEAVNWALDWAFQYAGLHRFVLDVAAFNEDAVKLYRKLGFVEEGRRREVLYHLRQWHDMIDFAMLEHEWEALRGVKRGGKCATPAVVDEECTYF
ncbi:acyl-CoA N-acyltransferase [Aspergillus sclerotiicarbonarius CBS 121057]|uniref:Acyl-CoA N-acyltransferase n=1 Tax=Aspergillus sclerotiicarbonarius (strain CBS 121057 / IBT 28362) TaxID=1448318 RepID=A0A319EIV4_ASPSB|nr:acyl-CoA N-acyltransferase [Aspergillus sclerotiicarbonarius CBS 121057]